MEHIIHHLVCFGIPLHCTLETQPLGIAGSVKQAEKLLDETFLVIGGDTLAAGLFLLEFLARERISLRDFERARTGPLLDKVHAMLERLIG